MLVNFTSDNKFPPCDCSRNSNHRRKSNEKPSKSKPKPRVQGLHTQYPPVRPGDEEFLLRVLPSHLVHSEGSTSIIYSRSREVQSPAFQGRIKHHLAKRHTICR
nr:MAG TPA_asm: hypothetical protein [Caudoviricetes sp.]